MNTLKLRYFFLLYILLTLVVFVSLILNAYKEYSKELFSTNTTQTIPKVYLKGDISNILSKEEERKIFLRYESNENNFDAYASIKLQGDSSLSYKKKNYTIKLYKDDNLKEKKEIDLGWGAQNKYCLKANWIDKTHARNIVTAQLTSEIQKRYDLLNTAPNNGLIDGFPVEIYMNDKFLGLYTWNIPKDAWTFNMDKNNENHIVFDSKYWEPTNFFNTNATYEFWEAKVGEGSKEDLDKFNRVIDFVVNSSDEEFKKNFNQYLNLDSTIIYIIITEFAGLIDNHGKNMLMVTYDGNIWYPTLYDLDTSWGANYDGLSTIDYGNTAFIMENNLLNRTIDNFPNEIYEKYRELRKDILVKEYIMGRFNDFKYLIPNKTLKKEFTRWFWYDIPGYGYNQIEEYLDIRIPIVDNFFEEIKKR